jgi:hypothetical protein
MTFIMATPNQVMTYDEAIHCPSSWTLDQWMDAISQISGITYDKLFDVNATAVGDPTLWRSNLTSRTKRDELHEK